MNKTAKKRLLIAAASMILAGAILFATALALGGWDLSKLGTVDYVATTLNPAGDFENITVNVFTTYVKFLPSEDERCRIECYEDKEVKHTAEVKDGTLVIDTEDTRRWFGFISLSFKNPTMTVYLPKNEYGILDIGTDTGAVEIPGDLTFEGIKIDGQTGAVNCSASAKGSIDIRLDTGALVMKDFSARSMKLRTATGVIKLSGGTVAENIEIEADTGMVSLENIACKDLRAETDTGRVSFKSIACGGDVYAETDTGGIAFENVIGEGKFELKSNTGDIDLDMCDARELYLTADTGDISGKLLSDKIFFADSDTGRVSVPKSVTGGRCEVSTDTGDVNFETVS